jgi:hypothetical protein
MMTVNKSISEYIIERMKLDVSREPPYLVPADRWNLFPHLFNAAGFKRGAEVGVGGGRFARRLCEEVNGLNLYLVDPWRVYDYYAGRYDQAHMDRDFRKAMHRLRMFDVRFMREFSHVAVNQYEDGCLDFVHIDANRTFASVSRDLELWTPKVRKGGLLCGTCYYDERDPSIGQVKKAVDAWTMLRGIDPWFVAVHPRYPAWFWEVT